MRSLHANAIAGLLLSLCGCPGQKLRPCGVDGGCPPSSYCLGSVCTGPVAKGLTALVTPADPSVPVEQFYPDQLVPQGGFITLDLSAPQTLRGAVPLPPSCTTATGLPISFFFDTPTAIPGVPYSFFFPTDSLDQLDATLPSGLAFTERIQTATGCTPPLVRNFISTPGLLDVAAGAFTFLGPSDTLFIHGEVTNPGGRLPGQATVTVLSGAGIALSNTVPLNLTSGNVVGTFDVAVALAETALLVDAGCGAPICSQFQILVGPASVEADFPFMPIAVNTPVTDGGPLLDAGNRNVATLTAAAGAGLVLPMDPTVTVNLHGHVLDAEGDGGAEAVTVDITSVSGTIAACPTCFFVGQTTSDLIGQYSFGVPTGAYQLSIAPPLPAAGIDAGVQVVTGLPAFDLTEQSPGEVVGSVVQPGGAPLGSGQVQVFQLPAMDSLGAVSLDAGGFDVLLPPGSYLLVVEPDPATLLPDTAQETTVVLGHPARVTLQILEPGQLTGIVEAESADGGLPQLLAGAHVQFYFVTSAPGSGQQIAIPVASTFTDSQGFYSTPGPPTGL